MFSNAQLEDALENDQSQSRWKDAAEQLLTAINDWPTLNLSEPKDFLAELEREISGELSMANIEKYHAQLSLADAWKQEALTSILIMFNTLGDEIETLPDALKSLEKHYKLATN